MSNYVAHESTNDHDTPRTSKKRFAEDEGDEGDEDSDETIDVVVVDNSTTLTTVPAVVDAFMYTPEFRIHFFEYVPDDTLMALRVATKAWNAVIDLTIDEGVESGEMMVHYGNDINPQTADARRKMRALATRVIFLLNITKVGARACIYAYNLVVVDIPEGVERIGKNAFRACTSLTTVSFLTTSTYIGELVFYECSSLENVDLLHTNLQELGPAAFVRCSELTSMTIPDSLQTLGGDVFQECRKLVPSNINVDYVSIDDEDTTFEVVTYLRSQQLPYEDFMSCLYFRRFLLIPFITSDELLALRVVSQPWRA